MNTVKHTIATGDGRTLRVFEAGHRDGIPVLVQRGTPQSGDFYQSWVEDAQLRGIRLIGYERPGYGESTVRPGRTIASAASDVATIAGELGLRRLLTWGVSGGGPHVIASAALLPDLVVAAAALACPTPYPVEGFDYFAGTGESNIALSLAALESREACERVVESEAAKLLSATPQTLEEALRSLVCPADAEVLTTDFADFVIRTMHEGIGASRAGWVDEEIAFMKPWGFELEQIRIPVLIMHGGQDLMVPFSHGKWLARKIPHAEARFLPNDGHITLHLCRITEVHEWLLGKW